MPRVSVVIPTYNCAHYLAQAIESVLNQTFRDLEIFVVDDGSKDNTADIAAAYGAHITYLRQENRGLPAARNRAIRASTSELIALLDADDWWEPTKLEKQIALLDQTRDQTRHQTRAQTRDQTRAQIDDQIDAQKNAQTDPSTPVALVYTDLRVLYDDGAVIPSFLQSRPLAADGHVFANLIQSGFILPSTVLLRRACLEQTGLFDETMRSHEDIDLWLRICHRYSVASVREPLVNRRQGAGNMTANSSLRAEYGVKTYTNALTIPNLTTAERLALDVRLRAAHFESAYHFFSVGDGPSCRRHLALSRTGGRWSMPARRLYLLSLLPPGVLAWARRSLRPQPGS